MVLGASTERSYCLMDSLISADLLAASTSAEAPTQAASLKSRLDRLQESRRAVEMFAELSETLEGRSLYPLEAEVLLNRLQIISSMLSPEQNIEPPYLLRFVHYLMNLVKCIIDAYCATKVENLSIFCKSPQVR